MMSKTTHGGDPWPELDYAASKETIDALHMRSQVVGKVKVGLTRTAPEWQNLPLFVNARGLTTGLMYGQGEGVEITFDLVDHRLSILTTGGQREGFALVPCPLHDFTSDVLTALDRLGVDVTIDPRVVEVPKPVRLDLDRGFDAYDPDAANRVFRVLARTASVFEDYRAGFWGKQPPVSFWWGTFDLAVIRYNLHPVPPTQGMDQIARVAMDSQHIAVGFWPGNESYRKPAFFGYTYPKPADLEGAEVRPDAAGWSAEMGEFLLDYEDVRTASDPRGAIMGFADSTYEAGAELAGWDRELLERRPPR